MMQILSAHRTFRFLTLTILDTLALTLSDLSNHNQDLKYTQKMRFGVQRGAGVQRSLGLRGKGVQNRQCQKLKDNVGGQNLHHFKISFLTLWD